MACFQDWYDRKIPAMLAKEDKLFNKQKLAFIEIVAWDVKKLIFHCECKVRRVREATSSIQSFLPIC